MSLSEASVVELSLDYRESPRTDQHGNEFRYIARGGILEGNNVKEMWTTDVFFKILDE